MSAAPVRQLVATFVIAGGACIGGYEFFAAPAKERLAAVQEKADGLQARIEQVERAAEAGPVLHQRAEECRLAAAALQRLGAAARQEASLFASIEALAAENGVIVDRISPSRTRATAAAARSEADKEQVTNDKAVGIELTVRASYEDVVNCVRELQRSLGVCRVESVAIAPGTGEARDAVTASIRLTVFAIEVAEAAPSGEQQGGRS